MTSPTECLSRSPLRLNFEALAYLAASVMALTVDLGLFSVAIRLLSIPWFLASLIGFASGATIAYLLSINFVFAKRRLRKSPRIELAIFILIGLAGICLTQFLLWIGIDLLHALPELVKLAAAGVTFMFNYIVRKTFLFSDSKTHAS